MPSKEGRKFSEASTEPSVVMPKGALRKVPRNVVTREESAAMPKGALKSIPRNVVSAGALRTPERATEPSGVMATIKTAVTSEEASAPRRKKGGEKKGPSPTTRWKVGAVAGEEEVLQGVH